jgi:Zn-finger nucleic acid-binding protein
MNVLACPRCDRQFDVTHLAAGERVRCACDETFVVGWRRPLDVGALCCSNCKGTVGPDDRACPFCDAKLADEDRSSSLLCPGCFRRLEDDARHCSGCGIEIRPQALVALPEGTACPRCESALQHRSLAGSDVVECTVCRGLWVTREAFQRVCRQAVSGDGIEVGRAPAPVELSGAVKYVPCLSCGELMLRRQFRHEGNASHVVIDHCREHGVWLDSDELERIVGFLAARGAGVPGEIGNLSGGERAPRRAPVDTGPVRPRSVRRGADVLWDVTGDVVHFLCELFLHRL